MAIDFNKIGLGGGKNYTFTSPDNTININEVDDEVQLQVNKQVAFTLPVSSDPAIDNAKYNDFGLLTDNVTITYPATDPGEVKIYYGKFQVDLDGLYSVDFGNDVILTGDTEMHPYSVYLFQIVGNYAILKEIRYGGLKNKIIGKVISGFSGDHVVVSVNGTNTNVTVGSDGWFFYDVAPSVTSVKFYTSDMTNFEKIYLVDLNGFTNCSSMFRFCSNLTTVDLSSFNTSAVTDMSSMFEGCSKLTTLDLSNFNTSAVTNINSMFNNCSSLTALDVSSFNTSGATNMTFMFNGCSNLTTLDLSNFNTSAVTNMSQMFASCNKLTTLDVSSFNTSAVTNMSNMFRSCSKLTTLDLSSFNTSAVTNMSYMFANCSSLTALDVSSFNTSAVTDMSYMFNGCSKLTTLDVSSFNTSAVTNMSYMFSALYILLSINMDNILINISTNVSGMFNNSAAITTIYLRNSDTTTYDKINAVKPAGATIVTAA